MGLDRVIVNLPFRAPLPKPRRRPLLAATVAVSALAHAGLVAFLLAEIAAKPQAGAMIEIEIAAMPGAATAGQAADARAGSPGKAPERPTTAPEPSAAPNTRPPASAATPPAASPEAAASPTVKRPESRAAVPPQPPVASTAEAPPPLAAPKPIARAETEPKAAATPFEPAAPPPEAMAKPDPLRPPPAAEAATAQPRLKPPPTAAVPRAANPRAPAKPTTTDVAAAETANDAAPGSGLPASPPRYGLGSAANPLPRYPDMARERGWEGLVVLTVAVSAAGTPDSVAISRSSGHETLDRAALEAVRRWRFEPARRVGMAIAGTVSVPIRFRLDD